MSINSCSINEHTINSLCGRRRQAIINSLLPQTGGGQQQHVNPTAKRLNIFNRRDTEEQIIDFDTLELPSINVKIELNGVTFSQTLDRDNNHPLINVYSLKILSGSEVTENQINISDIKLRILK